MAIIASELKFYLSGGAGNTDPDAALGGVISTTEVVDDTLNNLFDDVSGAEHSAGETNYRCIYVKNTNGSDEAFNSKLYISSNSTGVDSSLEIGLDLAGLNAEADTIPDEDTAPDPAVTFTTADGYANALDLSGVPAGEYYAIWVKRIIAAGATAQALDEATLTLSVDTA